MHFFDWMPNGLRRWGRRRYESNIKGDRVVSYSQEGEDRILEKLFCEVHRGFYVDVGAHHPRRFSNTYLFYRRGWSGINIDAMPGSMKLFRRIRPRDVNLEVAISESPRCLTYRSFREPAFNGFGVCIDSKHAANPGWELLWEREMTTRRLDSVLAECLPAGRRIDFLSIDVEGLDLEVLRSCDLERHRPTAIVIEMSVVTVDDVYRHPVHSHMKNRQYILYSKLCNSCIYVTEERAAMLGWARSRCGVVEDATP